VEVADMPEELVVECPKQDISDLDGIEYTITPIKRMHGGSEAVELVLKIVPATIPFIAKFLTTKSKLPVGRRRVLIDGQRKVFEEYSAEEVVKILKALNNGGR
jgi:hypothetical protein